jgi:hypothetical protein
MPELTLTKKERFNAMVQITSGLIVRSQLPAPQLMVSVDTYLTAIISFVNTRPEASSEP